MQDHLKPKPNHKEEDKALQARLDEVVKVPLKRRDIIVIHNILSGLSYKLGDAEIIIHKILPQLTPYAAVDTNISEESHEKQLAVGKKVD